MSERFDKIQETVRDLIAANVEFSADAATTVFEDFGTVKDKLESALDKKGYNVAVWPPSRGSSDVNASGKTGTNVVTVVRIEFSPKKLKAIQAAHDSDGTKPKPGAYVNKKLKAIFSAVLSAEAEDGGVRFQVPEDSFEMANFDEGLLAYHIRFVCFTVLG